MHFEALPTVGEWFPFNQSETNTKYHNIVCSDTTIYSKQHPVINLFHAEIHCAFFFFLFNALPYSYLAWIIYIQMKNYLIAIR